MTDLDLRNLPGLKFNDLNKLGPCRVCGEAQLGHGVTFYVVHVQRAVFDVAAIERNKTIMSFCDNPAVAYAMAPSEPLARVYDEGAAVFIHEHCAHQINSVLELMKKEKDHD